MDQLSMLRAFVAAAQHRSFSKAAASLGVTTGSISKAIAKLEASVKTRLLHRTTRSVTVTEAAQSYYESCCRLLQELDEANRRIVQEREIDSGKLRLVVHPMLAGEVFSRFVAGYRLIAPNVNLIVSIRPEIVDLYNGDCDMAIVPPELVEQSAVIRRTLWKSPRVFVACAGYLNEHGTPRRAMDLVRHWLLLDSSLRQKGTHFVELIERNERVSVLPMSSVDGDAALLRNAALAGTGVALLPEAIVRADIEDGRLVRLLPECASDGGEAEICLFYPHRALLPVRFRTFIDYCAEFFRANDPARAAERKAVSAGSTWRVNEAMTMTEA